MTEVALTEVCDFCSSPDVKWAYPARDFTLAQKALDSRLPDGPDWGSRGGWAACQRCYALIEADDHEGLVRRCAETYVVKAKRDPALPRAAKRMKANEHLPAFRRVHGEFWRNRTGPPRPANVLTHVNSVTMPDGGLRHQ